MAKAPHLDQQTLKRLLFYDPDVGVFIWHRRADKNECWNARYAGKPAGYDWSPTKSLVYRAIPIFGWTFLAHRLAFLYITGAWPTKGMDHKDCNGTNNRWSNLREATKSQNGANQGVTSRNKLRIKGVHIDANGRYRAQIKFQGKCIYLGVHPTAQAAHAVYCAATIKYFGEFGRGV